MFTENQVYPANLSRTGELLARAADCSYRAPWAVFSTSCLLAVACLFAAYLWLGVDTSRSALVNSGEELEILSRRYQEEFPLSEEIVVVAGGGTKAERTRLLELTAQRLFSEPKLFQMTLVAVDTEFLRPHALCFLSESELRDIEKSFAQLARLDRANGSGVFSEEALPFLTDTLEQLLRSLRSRGRSDLVFPWSLDDRATFNREHISAGEGRLTLLLTRPRHPQLLTEARHALETHLIKLGPAFPGVRTQVTGEKILEQDETDSSSRDSAKATIMSLMMIGVLFAVGFGSLTRSLQAVTVVALAGCWTLGVTTLLIGHLNLLTVTFATILAGMGIDFAIHFSFRYEEERAGGLSPLAAMRATLRTAGRENLAGAWATAFSFLAVCFTGFRGIAELGAISAFGIILSFLGALFALPALIFIEEKFRPHRSRRTTWGWLAGFEQFYLNHPRWILAAALVFSFFSVSQFQRASFDGNLLSLQDQSLPSVQAELSLAKSGDQSLMFAVSLAEDLERARQLKAQYQALSTVSRVETLADMVPEVSPRKQKMIEMIASYAGGAAVPTDSELKGNDFGEMERFYRDLQRLAEGEGKEKQRLRTVLKSLAGELQTLGHGPIYDGVESFRSQALHDWKTVLQFLSQQVGRAPSIEHIPVNISGRGIGRTGAFSLRIYPKENCWERKSAERFVEQLRTVDPQVVGTPVLLHHHTEALRRAFVVSGYHAFLAVVLLLWLHFRNVRETLLALMPKALSMLWMIGLMGWTGVRFNPANFIALPLILGVGVIFGVHVVHRVAEDGSAHVFRHSTGPAVALSALTTIAGFGTLALAGHQGIASLGMVMVYGVGTGLIASLVVLPALMTVLQPNRRYKSSDGGISRDG